MCRSKLFDLDKGLETTDLDHDDSFRRYQGDGMAISPDGSKVALFDLAMGGDACFALPGTSFMAKMKSRQ